MTGHYRFTSLSLAYILSVFMKCLILKDQKALMAKLILCSVEFRNCTGKANFLGLILQFFISRFQCNDILINGGSPQTAENLPSHTVPGRSGSEGGRGDIGSASNVTTYLISFFVLVVCLIVAVTVVIYCRKKSKGKAD